MTALLALHAGGDAAAGRPWEALADGWQDGQVLTPDLPGHGTAPPPTGATYAPADAALHGARVLREAGLAGAALVVVGVGSSGFGAELLAAGGRASALVLVDGLGPPWLSYRELLEDVIRWMRGVAADPEALAPPTSVPDPRLRHGVPSVWERSFTASRRGAITVPVLALESPASPTPAAEREDRLAAFAGPTRCAEVGEATPAAVGSALGDHRGFLVGGEAG